MSENHCKHSLESNAILYLPLHKGGKGLQQLEVLYKSTKIKTAHYVTTSNEPHVQLVATFQKYKETKSFRSMFKDAKMFADQLNLDVEYDITKKTTIASNKEQTEVAKCQLRNMKSILKKQIEKKREEELEQQPWVRQYLTNQWHNKDLEKESHNINNIWKNISDVVFSIHTSIQQQLITTKVFRRKKLKEGDGDSNTDVTSREETVPHLLCQCSAIAQSLHKARHDRLLRPIYHQIISLWGFAEDEDKTSWHKQPTSKPSVENERAKILWDIPIYLDIALENGANKPDIVVLDEDKETLIIVEGTRCKMKEVKW